MDFRWLSHARPPYPAAWTLTFQGTPIGEVRSVNRNLCPFCWGVCEAEFVDVGLGGQGVQVTPYECAKCGAIESRGEGWLPGPDGPRPPKQDIVYAGYLGELAGFREGPISRGASPAQCRRHLLQLAVNTIAERVARACARLPEDWG